jgi:hypothetical protein
MAANSIFYHCFRPVVAPRNPANTFFDSATATVQPATRSNVPFALQSALAVAPHNPANPIFHHTTFIKRQHQ